MGEKSPYCLVTRAGLGLRLGRVKEKEKVRRHSRKDELKKETEVGGVVFFVFRFSFLWEKNVQGASSRRRLWGGGDFP